MGNVDKFLAKSKEVEILGEKYKIYPLTVNELESITKSRSNDSKVSAEGTREVAFSIFKQICPEMTMEQFNKIELSTLDDVMLKYAEAFQSSSSAKTKLIAKLKAGQNAK